jgi:arylsulfatase
MAHRPNILLIQTDQLSAGSLGLYGHPLVETPTLEALADRAVVFDNAFCNHPACVPSRCSMFTGRYPSATGSYENFIHLYPRERSLAHVLKDAGYFNVLIGKNHAFDETPGPDGVSELHRWFDYVRLGSHSGMVAGYEHDEALRASAAWAHEHCWSAPGAYGTNPCSPEATGTYVLGEVAQEFLRTERPSDPPFFLWLSLPDPHTPYQAPEPYASMYDPADVPPPIADDLTTKPERQRVAAVMDAVDRTPVEHLQALRAIHYGMINQIDDAVGRVLATLDEQGLREDTIVIFTSDHGDSLGDHQLMQKQNAFYESIIRVPLMLSWPGRLAPQRMSDLVEHVDLMPTLLDLVGLEFPAEVQGRSFAGLVDEGQRGYHPREYVTIESGSPGDPPTLEEIGDARPEGPWDETYFTWCANPRAWAGPGKCIRTHQWKLNLYENGDGELYDLSADPDELINRYGDSDLAIIAADLKEKLVD